MRRARTAVWHECKDMDLALWLSGLNGLSALRRTKDVTLRDLQKAGQCNIASHQADVLILEPGSDRYLGRLCHFAQCPKGKPECAVPGCGAKRFLQQHQDFHWCSESLTADRALCLFDRTAVLYRRAGDLPLETAEDDAQLPAG